MTKSFALDYAKYYDFFNKGKDYAAEVAFLSRVFEKYSSNPVKNILNLGCGTGMHELEFVKHGYVVDGLDLSAEMINIAKSRNIPGTSFHVGDMSNFELGKKFDACVSMFAAFGYLTENKQIESSLMCIRKHLNPGGIAVIEIWNGLGVVKIMPSSRVKEFERDGLGVHRQSFPTFRAEEQRVDIKFDVKISKDGKEIDKYDELHKMRFFFPQEMKYYFDKAGFDVMEICKTFELCARVDENEWNMVVIARAR